MVKKGLSLGGSLEQLEESLKFAQAEGVEAVELSIERLQLIFNGLLHPARTEMAVGLLRQYPFSYSVHQPKSLDLRNRRFPEATDRVMSSVQSFCSMIGSRILVVHYEMETVPEEEQQFEQLLMKAANRSDQVVLAVENIEIERSGKVADLVRRLDHPQIMMTYDLGHDFLASAYYGYDQLQAIESFRDLVVHLHVNDNFGKFEELRITNRPAYNAFGHLNWSALGRGDLHLPIGWGAIDYERLLKPFQGFDGLVITEVRGNYYALHSKDILSGLDRVGHILEAR